jgi:hypothetical protein
MIAPGPISRLERQRARARRGALAPLDRDYVPPSTEEIFDMARAQRRSRPTPEYERASGLSRPLPFAPVDLLPPERELFLRVFSGTTAFSRRKAVRAWQHKLRAKREQARAGTSPRMHSRFRVRIPRTDSR